MAIAVGIDIVPTIVAVLAGHYSMYRGIFRVFFVDVPDY